MITLKYKDFLKVSNTSLQLINLVLCLIDSRVELKRLCEIFTRMFADPHSKVCTCFTHIYSL